ncbi:fluoride efflux transporter CrcB [Melghirimyces algeriensis]|uniref:Fluoride-specific ion channel FluC n=1 Tax=Melghirimyces algeriensis TaxID=910412 RepID=A0A521AV44_9BACL|nr:fluoride efflux transporter CrcB [Melghirimyces algeriensis]SMO38718.1 CrcB protein [Melghirimyces algeriensis]
MRYFSVGIGGIIGSLFRYGLGVALFSEEAIFPTATLCANWIGCMVLGWLNTHTPRSSLIQDGIGTGLIGSFTTFSTFSVETLALFQHGHWISAWTYILTSLVGGLLLVHVGSRLARLQKEETEC